MSQKQVLLVSEQLSRVVNQLQEVARHGSVAWRRSKPSNASTARRAKMKTRTTWRVCKSVRLQGKKTYRMHSKSDQKPGAKRITVPLWVES